MGSPINFGSRVFGTRNQGRGLSQDNSVKNITRISTLGFSEAMTALSMTATANLLFPVIKGCSIIIIKKVVADCIFNNNSLGLYMVSDRFIFSVVGTYLVNKDSANAPTMPVNLSSESLDLMVQVDSNSQVNLQGVIYGGSIQMVTGITPGAGGSVVGGISIIYEPL